ncbi:hypothetical protein QR680_016133 [Steinernema hermaphroditum]|uniref:Uncharacterized protein n=1 Tax=Steinernema hermaphroditum TaxID=289476 RepID=A0AA39LLX8_9BILA|nr:hypothetical protein QR680_016133 [Steinernema hermaphroditum]
MLWIVCFALLSVAAATSFLDKWRLESFCANGVMRNGRCYKALLDKDFWLRGYELSRESVQYCCYYHAMDYYNPLLLSKDMESADIALYIYASVPFVSDPVIKELDSAGLLESNTAYRAAVYGDYRTRNIIHESAGRNPIQRGLLCSYEYYYAAVFEDFITPATPLFPVAASSKEWRIERFCRDGKMIGGKCFKALRVEDIAYGLPIHSHFDVMKACQNALIKYYLPIFASKMISYGDILKYFESYPVEAHMQNIINELISDGYIELNRGYAVIGPHDQPFIQHPLSKNAPHKGIICWYRYKSGVNETELERLFGTPAKRLQTKNRKDVELRNQSTSL